MRISTSIMLLTLAAALAACSAETTTDTGEAEPTAEPTAPTDAPTDGPAGEVAPESRVPTEAAAEGTAQLPEGVDEKWALYYEHGIAFEFGAKAGLAKAAETGKPMMMFYTATW